jgi:hypothetical protein
MCKLFYSLLVCIVSVTLSSCAGAYGEYYHAVSAPTVPNKHHEPKTIVVDVTPTSDTLVKYKLRLLGYSSFIGSFSNETTLDCAAAQGADVGADLVVVTKPTIISSDTRLVAIPHTATVSTNTQTTSSGVFGGTWSGSSYGSYRGTYNGSSSTSSESTIEYTTNEYRTFTTYRFHALFLERAP